MPIEKNVFITNTRSFIEGNKEDYFFFLAKKKNGLNLSKGTMNTFTKLFKQLFCIWAIVGYTQRLLASAKLFGMLAGAAAFPQDATGPARNPGTAVFLDNSFTFDLFMGHVEGRVKVHGNQFFNGSFRPIGTRDKNQVGTESGLVYRYSDQVAIGFTSFGVTGTKTKYKEVNHLLGTSKQGEELQVAAWAPFIGYQLGCHGFGISYEFIFQRIKLQGLQNIDNPMLTVAPGHVTNRKYDYSIGLGVKFGWMWNINRFFAVGLAYQPKIHMRKFHKYRGSIANWGEDDVFESIQAGIAWHPNAQLTLASDISYERYDNIRPAHNPLLPNALLQKSGAPKGPGTGWRNRITYAIGANYQINESWTIRGGYAYVRIPIKRTETLNNSIPLLYLDKHDLAAGFTWRITCSHELSFYYVHLFRNKIKGKNSIPITAGGGEIDIVKTADAGGFSWNWYY